VKPMRASDLMLHATPFERGPGHRTPQTMLLLDERDKLLVEASRFFPGLSQREAARRLRSALSIYAGGRWERDRAEATCPPQYRGKLVHTMWLILKTHDHVPSEMTIRRALFS